MPTDVVLVDERPLELLIGKLRDILTRRRRLIRGQWSFIVEP
jgi:hypothetical protein